MGSTINAMQNEVLINIPEQYDRIAIKTKELQFNMASDRSTGSLLKTLVASKPGARILELGTGTGLATAWILDGMDNTSQLISLEKDKELINVAKGALTSHVVDFVLVDAYDWIRKYSGPRFDFIFADAIPGKYDLLNETLDLLKPGGLYVIDDMLPQSNWPDGHSQRVDDLIARLESRTDLVSTRLQWSTGIIIAAKKVN
jgi:predicted O-methyltransferase YrrM